jgi:hypothetical protein
MRTATNMTDEENALSCLMRASESRELALEEFFDKWKVSTAHALQFFELHEHFSESAGRLFSALQMDYAASNVECAW